MTKGIVYLAGLISTDYPASLQWREEVTPVLLEAGFKVLSPMRGKNAVELINGGLHDPSLTSKDIVFRDYHDVAASTVLLAHLEVWDSPRPMIGTIAELSWAWLLKIPAVAVAWEYNLLMREHPFLKEFVSHYFPTVEDATDFVISYYGRRENGSNL
jgi:nucleoside 2-deoxyribosyltransferase